VGVLEKLERLLEQGIEKPLARTFSGRVHPLEIARKLELEASAHQRTTTSGSLVPDHYQVALAPTDLEELAPISAGLAHELAAYVLERAKSEGYLLLAEPIIELTSDEALRPGQFTVKGSFSGNPPEFVLSIESGPDSGRTFTFTSPKILLGRSASCEVTLNDQRISRKHAELAFDGAQFLLSDLNSTNGTFVNGERIRQAALPSGATFGLGVTTLRFTVPLWDELTGEVT